MAVQRLALLHRRPQVAFVAEDSIRDAKVDVIYTRTEYKRMLFEKLCLNARLTTDTRLTPSKCYRN